MTKTHKQQFKQILGKAYNAVYWLLLFNLIALGWPGKILAASGDGLLVYGSSTTGDYRLHYRTWSPSSYGNETDGSPTSTVRWAVLKASPTNAGIYVKAVVTTDATNNILVYSGTTAETSEWTATQLAGQTSKRGVDLAFENTSGNVLVVYLTSTDTDTIYYQEGTWNGADYDWSSGSFTDPTIGNFRYLKLATRLNSDQMILGATGDDATNQVNAWIWDGSSFGNEGGNGGWGLINGTYDNMDVAYETSTVEPMIVWGIATGIKWATYSGGSWGTSTYTTPGNPTRNLGLTADPEPTSDDLALGFIEDTTSDDVWGSIWTGNGWAFHTELDTNTETSVARNVDVAYAGTTGNAILVYGDSSGGTVDWARSTGDGAFVLQGDFTPTASMAEEYGCALVPDASGSNVIMYNLVDLNSDIFGYYYDDDTTSWADPQGAALEMDNSANAYESFMFAWESVYRVPTLTEILFLALVGCAVFLGIRTGIIRIRKNGRLGPKDIQDPPKKNIPPVETLGSDKKQIQYRHQGHPLPRLRVTKSIDGLSRRERN